MRGERSTPRRGRRIAIASLAAIALCFAFAAPASASSGSWSRAWGKDVISGGSTGAEICTTATSCKAGTTGGLGGELNQPYSTATDANGNVYVADLARIQKFDSSGNFLRTWGKDVIASGHPGDTGTGFEICTVAADCKAGVFPGGAAGEMLPKGVATDGSGNVYVSDYGNARIQKFDSSGNFLRAWGKDVVASGPDDTGTGFEICIAGTGDVCKAATFGTVGGDVSTPGLLAVDGSNNVIVADSGNDRVQEFNSNGGFIRTWGRNVDAVAAGTDFEICSTAANCKGGVDGGLGGEFTTGGPFGVAADSGGNIYVSDLGGGRVQKFDSSGNFLRTWGKDVVASGPDQTAAGEDEVCVAGVDTCKIAGSSGGLPGEFNVVAGVAADPAGGVYVSDNSNQWIQKFDSAGAFLSAWGRDADGSDPDNGYEVCTVKANCIYGLAGTTGGAMTTPNGLSANAAGDVFLADFGNNRIQKFSDTDVPGGGGGGNGNGNGNQNNPPSNAFTIGKLKKLKLPVTVASQGTVKLVDAASKTGRATISKRKLLLKPVSVSGGPGKLIVKLKLTASAKKKLKKAGKLKVRARVTFTPGGGTAATKTAALKIKGKKR